MNGLMATLAVAATLAGAAPVAASWTSDYAGALKAARTAKRPLVVVFENPNNPAQKLDQAVFAAGHPLDHATDRFELCRVDVTTKMGQRVAEAFGAANYPYTAITDRDVKVIVHRREGKPSARAWEQMLASVSGPPIPTRTSAPAVRRYRQLSPRMCFS